MRFLLAPLMLAATAAATLAAPGAVLAEDIGPALAAETAQTAEAPAPAFSDLEQDEIRRLVRDYLIANPEVIEEAIYALQDSREAAKSARQREAIAALQDELFNDPRDFAVGPADAPVQIVEFFDYNCTYCRQSAPWVKALLEEHAGQVRFVFKDAPIFAERSESSAVGARAATAAVAEGRYLDLYFALMESSGTIPVSQVRRIAEGAGLNWRRAEAVMDAPETTLRLADTLDLLDAVGGTGTPAFVINGELVPGADFDRLDAIIEAAIAAEG
jgi:protein-disulfide isomerase